MRNTRSLTRLRPIALAVILGSWAQAQNDMGIETGGLDSNIVAGRATTSPAAVVSRWDRSDYHAIGFSSAAPGMHLDGLATHFYDHENPGTESFQLAACQESGNTNQPDWSTLTLLSGPIAAPIGATTRFFEARVNFASPYVALRDLFVGHDAPAIPATESFGLWFRCVSGQYGYPTYDFGGPAWDPFRAHMYITSNYVNTTGIYPSGYFLCDPIVRGAGGMATAITNQIEMPSSADAPGIAGFHSGNYPDVDGRRSPGRLDDPGYRYADSSMAGQPVLFFISFNGFALSPLPLDSVFPGSSGSWCINDGLFLAVVPADGAGVAFLNLALDPAARSAMGGSGLAAQMYAVGFDGTRLSGAPCANVVY
jgi:hypothetical protein